MTAVTERTERCESISALHNVRCDRPKGHEGPHVSEWYGTNHSSRAIWQDATFKMNFLDEDKQR